MLAADAKAGRARSFFQHAAEWLHSDSVPELWPELAPIHEAHGRLGQDANGSSLLSERNHFFDRAGLDPGLEDAVDHLFDQLDSETALVNRERIESMRDGQN